MEIFLDSANLDEIREAASWGVVAGVTTNPSLVAKEGGAGFYSRVRAIAGIVSGPVSAEAVSLEKAAIVREAAEIAALAPNVIVKVPVCPEGLGAVAELESAGIKTNVTLVFSPAQAVLAAAAGASYVSPFVGRLDDIGQDGIGLVRDIRGIFAASGTGTKIIAASIRSPKHVLRCAQAGADCATVPFKILKTLFDHPLTAKGIADFAADWRRYSEAPGK